jgi:hypothetical protein
MKQGSAGRRAWEVFLVIGFWLLHGQEHLKTKHSKHPQLFLH